MRKPGRPLSSCPHPTGSCSCERVVINYTIPKTSECACPSERSQPIAVSNGTGRVQKSRSRKSTSNFNTSVLEKAIKAAQDGETDSSSQLTQTPTSESNNASNPSSASSTPRLLPLQKENVAPEVLEPEVSASTSRPATSHSQAVSSCCKPKPVQAPTKSCCSSKTKDAAPVPPTPAKKSCCSGSTPAQQVPTHVAQPPIQPNMPPNFPTFPQYPTQFHNPYNMVHHGNGYMHMPPPFSFNTPIYNHMLSHFQPQKSMPLLPINNHTATHTPEHNCQCGDSCSCFGCAAHPNNATMMEYVRSMHEFMSTGQFGAMPPPTYDLPSYPHQPGFGAEANFGFNPAPNFPAPNHINFQAGISTTMHMPQTPLNAPTLWSQASTPAAVPTEIPFFDNTNITQAPIQDTSASLKREESIQSPATFADSPSEGKDEDATTLSPSSYFWQEMVLPGCNDATGTCQCGDGCECVGCLTHGGHNGVSLEMAASNEQEAFPDLVTSTEDLMANTSNQFLNFSTGPT